MVHMRGLLIASLCFRINEGTYNGRPYNLFSSKWYIHFYGGENEREGEFLKYTMERLGHPQLDLNSYPSKDASATTTPPKSRPNSAQRSHSTPTNRPYNGGPHRSTTSTSNSLGRVRPHAQHTPAIGRTHLWLPWKLCLAQRRR